MQQLASYAQQIEYGLYNKILDFFKVSKRCDEGGPRIHPYPRALCYTFSHMSLLSQPKNENNEVSRAEGADHERDWFEQVGGGASDKKEINQHLGKEYLAIQQERAKLLRERQDAHSRVAGQKDPALIAIIHKLENEEFNQKIEALEAKMKEIEEGCALRGEMIPDEFRI